MLARMKVDMDADVVVDEVANMLANMEVNICTRWPTWWPTSRGWLIGPKLFRPEPLYPACASSKLCDFILHRIKVCPDLFVAFFTGR